MCEREREREREGGKEREGGREGGREREREHKKKKRGDRYRMDSKTQHIIIITYAEHNHNNLCRT